MTQTKGQRAGGASARARARRLQPNGQTPASRMRHVAGARVFPSRHLGHGRSSRTHLRTAPGRRTRLARLQRTPCRNTTGHRDPRRLLVTASGGGGNGGGEQTTSVPLKARPLRRTRPCGDANANRWLYVREPIAGEKSPRRVPRAVAGLWALVECRLPVCASLSVDEARRSTAARHHSLSGQTIARNVTAPPDLGERKPPAPTWGIMLM